MTATVVLFPTFGVPRVGEIARTKEGKFYLLSAYHTTINVNELTKMEIHLISNDSIRKDDYYFINDSIMKKVDNQPNSIGRKIIYTTDQNLINDGIQQLGWDYISKILEDLNKSALKMIYYDTKLVCPMGRALNPLDLSKNTSSCKWVYSLSYGVPFPEDTILETPINQLLSQVDFDGTSTPAQYTSKQIKVLLYRYIKEVSGRPIFDTDEQWINENVK